MSLRRQVQETHPAVPRMHSAREESRPLKARKDAAHVAAVHGQTLQEVFRAAVGIPLELPEDAGLCQGDGAGQQLLIQQTQEAGIEPVEAAHCRHYADVPGGFLCHAGRIA